RASGCTLCRGRAWTAAGVARPADNAASGPPRANETRSCGQSPASGRWPISKGLWRTTLEPATHPHLCTSRLLLLVEFGDGVLQRWGFFIPAILRNMFPAVLSILVVLPHFWCNLAVGWRNIPESREPLCDCFSWGFAVCGNFFEASDWPFVIA